MFEAMSTGFQMLTPGVLLYSLLGVIVASAVASMPGLGGAFVLVVLMPFTFAMDTIEAVALLAAAVVVTSTANTITGCLFGVPGSASGAATVFDGYPMSKRGEGGRAVAAGLTASLLGGLVGAFGLALILPLARPMVLNLGPAEFFVTIFLAILLISTMQDSKTSKGLISAMLGFMLSFVGIERASAQQRFTFDELYFFDGLPLVPIIIGVFALAEMMELGKRRGSIASADSLDRQQLGLGWPGVKRGMMDPIRSWRVTLEGSVVGLVVGATPGLGSVAAQYLAYARGAATTRIDIPFGKGNVDGVVASDAATNSKEGGSLIPTLLFGIPGSPVMAILLAALISIGISPGPRMMDEELPIVWMIIWLIVLANIVATVLSLAATGPISRLTTVPSHRIIPAVVCISLWGAFTTSLRLGDIILAMGIGVLGHAFKVYGYSRVTFVIGLVLAPLLEHYWILANRLYGWQWIYRPFTLLLFSIPLIVVGWKRFRGRRGTIKDRLKDEVESLL